MQRDVKMIKLGGEVVLIIIIMYNNYHMNHIKFKS